MADTYKPEDPQNKLWDYRILHKVGQGEYGAVYKVIHKRTDVVYALKKIPISHMTQKEKAQSFREIKALKHLEHPNIIKYYESFLSADNLYIVMEFAERGDLLQEIIAKKRAGVPYKEGELWDIYLSLAGAVRCLHNNHIIHRDIKLENIFITKDRVLKLGDLGLSKILEEKKNSESTRVGTPIYFAPQLIQHQNYSFPIDVWALGCVCYFLANLAHPFEGATLETLAFFVLNKPLKPLRYVYSVKLTKIVFTMLTKDVAQRPDISQVISMVGAVEQHQTKVQVFNPRIISDLSDADNVPSSRNLYARNRYSNMSRMNESNDLIELYQKMKARRDEGENDGEASAQPVERNQFEQTKVDLSDLLKTVRSKRFKDLKIEPIVRDNVPPIFLDTGSQQNLSTMPRKISNPFFIQTNGFLSERETIKNNQAFKSNNFKITPMTSRYRSPGMTSRLSEEGTFRTEQKRSHTYRESSSKLENKKTPMVQNKIQLSICSRIFRERQSAA